MINKILWSIRILTFYLGLIPATVLFAAIATCCWIFPSNIRYWIITRWSHFFIWWGKTICGLQYKVIAKENIPRVPCVVVANHQSMWETIFMQVLLPPQSWILKKELLFIPFFGWGLALLNPIAIDRKNKFSAKTIMKRGLACLTAGRWVLVYPEGTRVAANTNKNFSRTAAALAIHANVPILPIAHNAGKLWPKGFWIKQPGIITVQIGQPIAICGQTSEEITLLAQQWIEQHKSNDSNYTSMEI